MSSDFTGDVEEELLISSLEDKLYVVCGISTEGKMFGSIKEMWTTELGDNNISTNSSRGRSRWYNQARDYWEDAGNCPSTIDGVLGGFASISDLDLDGSQEFLLDLNEKRPLLNIEGGSCCDCGAGIGRITKGLLLPIGFQKCDLVEVSQRLIYAAPDFLGDNYAGKCRYLCIGLQDFDPKPKSYDLIWIQWVIGHLTDVDCVKFLRRCANGLKAGGVICIKDNTCSGEDAFIVDKDDSSLTRSLPYLLHLCSRAGLKVILQKTQDNFPDSIYPVPIIALEQIE